MQLFALGRVDTLTILLQVPLPLLNSDTPSLRSNDELCNKALQERSQVVGKAKQYDCTHCS